MCERTTREEERRDAADAAAMEEAGQMYCPSCQTVIPKDQLKRCHCGARGCANCMKLMPNMECFDAADERWTCETSECEKTGLETLLKERDRMFSKDFSNLRTAYESDILPVCRRIAVLNVLEKDVAHQ